MMELVKTHFFNLILHVRRVTQVKIDTSRFGVKCPDLIGDAGGRYMFFLYLFYRLRLSKVSQSVSNKSYLILSYLWTPPPSKVCKVRKCVKLNIEVR